MVRILRLEPSRERARVTSSNDDPVHFTIELVLRINEGCNVSQGLVHIQVLKILGSPVFERLRLAIITMLK